MGFSLRGLMDHDCSSWAVRRAKMRIVTSDPSGGDLWEAERDGVDSTAKARQPEDSFSLAVIYKEAGLWHDAVIPRALVLLGLGHRRIGSTQAEENALAGGRVHKGTRSLAAFSPDDIERCPLSLGS